MRKLNRKVIFLLFFLICFIGIELFILAGHNIGYNKSNPTQTKFDVLSGLNTLKNKNKSLYESLEKELNALIIQGKISEALELSKLAIEQKEISMHQCHTLLHLMGHNAYSLFGDDYERLLSDANTFICGRAFHHGIEAEIASGSNDVNRDLNIFCEALHKKWRGLSCYHGAGHAFMSKNRDVKSSLLQCDSLINDINKDPADCYRGVFSEYAFMIQGVDGDTGLIIPGGPLVRLQESHPLVFCQKLDDKYQSYCAAQLSRVSINGGLNQSIEKCIDGQYTIKLKAACINNISAIFSQSELSNGNTITVPPIYFSLQEELRQSFILGMAQEFDAFFDSGVQKDAQSVCEHFKISEDKNFCIKRLTRTLQ